MLPRPNVLIVLLEYIDLFNPSDNMKQSFRRGLGGSLPFYIAELILSMAILQLTKCILLEFASIMPAFCSLLLPSYFSKLELAMPAKSTHPYL